MKTARGDGSLLQRDLVSSLRLYRTPALRAHRRPSLRTPPFHCPVSRLYVQLHLSSKHHSSVSSARDFDHVTLGFGNIGANTAIFSVVNGEPLHERIVGPLPSSAQEIPIHASVAAYSYLGCKKSFESSPSSPSLAVM